MRRIGFALLATFLLGMLAMPLIGCRTGRVAPRIGAHVGLVTDATKGIGPTASIDLGEIEGVTLDPFDTVDEASPAPAQPDPALAQALKDLEAKQAAAAEHLAQTNAALEQRLLDLDAKVASGDLSPAQAEAIKAGEKRNAEALAAAVRTGDESAKAAREAADKVSALETKLASLEAQPKPSFLPTDWTIPGLIAFVLGWARYLWGQRQKKALAEQIARAKAEAQAHAARAIEAFDNLPETASPAEVREAVRPPAPAPTV